MLEPNFVAATMLRNANKFAEAYYRALQPLCLETDLPPLAVDILLFLANNPAYNTAKDICQCRGVKPGIVSVHVDRLVTLGLLARQDVPGDRRKTALVLTEKAAPVIEQGRRLQKSFADRLTEGLRAEDLAHFRRCVAAFERNIERIRMENPKGTEM